ncbi:dTDP-4-dehydrorhamnose reductase [Subsaxibacter sp. CAU 1640]|uniref:dTDP-4-dehydrorhamnose reductase n=1 Tax=Subsaxibacter sp. CAU 1640 TaxID=2933271 RepID=UPI0020064B26|nr:dTDP-4-dehydrorhamnose reductase [Subsaxibacter sp. CAU 1640]MCK7589517.1 dTDP-4-dehydrorhamnose reductase [Subsaxibacter sp. CAU 1640]
MKTKILVTGANGQLGKTISDLYLHNEDDLEFVFVSKKELDISDKAKLTTYFEKNSFDYCINCAAYTNVEQAEESIEDAFKVNAEAVGHLAESCSNSNTILIHISTDYVFDGKKRTPYSETDETSPINQYGHSKLEGEKLIAKHFSEYFIIRTSWLYSKHPKNFVTTIVSKIKENRDLTITTSQEGTPTSCVELAKFIHHLIVSQNKQFGIYHFSAKGQASWFDFALVITENFQAYDRSKVKPVDSFKSKAERPEYSVMNNNKTQKIYHHQNDWKADVAEVVKTILSNN